MGWWRELSKQDLNILELFIVLSTLIFGMRHLVSSWIHPHKWYLSLVTQHSSFHVMCIVYTVEPPLLATTLHQPLFLSQQKVHTFTLVLTSYNGHLSTQQKPLEFVLVIKKTSWQLPVKQLVTNFEYKTKLFIGKGHQTWSVWCIFGLCFYWCFIDIFWLC